MLEIITIYKSLGEQDVLRGVNLDVKDGEIFTFPGESGISKSIFFKNIISFIEIRIKMVPCTF